MSDPQNPQTQDETTEMDGTITSVAVESIGTPNVVFWITDTATGDTHQMNGSLTTDAVSRLGMLHLLEQAVLANRDVKVRYTTQGDLTWFHLVRMF